MEAQALQVAVSDGVKISSLLVSPPKPKWLLVLGHGAGAGMRHPFLQALSQELASVGIATFRYQFPYMEERRRVPDAPLLLTNTVAAAVRTAAEEAPGIPILAGGKSMGGRMTSTAAAEGKLEGVRGLVFFGFPLHPPKHPATKRGDHLAEVRVPMLFLQGTRDDLAHLNLLTPIVKRLSAFATMHVIDGADHSFHILKSSGKTDASVLKELAQQTASWADNLMG